MTVYVVGCEDSQLVKIGCTAGDPERRLAVLQNGSPYRLRLLWLSTPEHDLDTKKKLHKLFEGYRRHGEWFDFGDADPVALVSAAVRLPQQRARPVPVRKAKSAERDFIADLTQVLTGEGQVRTHVVLTRLAEVDSHVYEGWTFADLKAALADVGISTRKYCGRMFVRSSDIRQTVTS